MIHHDRASPRRLNILHSALGPPAGISTMPECSRQPSSPSRLLPAAVFSSARTAFSTRVVIAHARSAATFSTGAAIYIGLAAAFSTGAASSTPVNSTR
jgi:hypothetical protein